MNDLMQIALGYAPRDSRAALTALWTLDATLGRVVATTTEPIIGQMRFTWWHDRLCALDTTDVAAEPVLEAVALVVRDHDVSGAALAILVEGWEALFESMPLDETTLTTFAALRGNGLFALSAKILGEPVSETLGSGWALVDFASKCSDQTSRERALALYTPTRIDGPKPLRILAQIAQATAARHPDQIMVPISRWALLRAVLS